MVLSMKYITHLNMDNSASNVVGLIKGKNFLDCEFCSYARFKYDT